jgi:hypothetical protein
MVLYLVHGYLQSHEGTTQSDLSTAVMLSPFPRHCGWVQIFTHLLRFHQNRVFTAAISYFTHSKQEQDVYKPRLRSCLENLSSSLTCTICHDSSYVRLSEYQTGTVKPSYYNPFGSPQAFILVTSFSNRRRSIIPHTATKASAQRISPRSIANATPGPK